jgi:DNA-binding NarL/FixJ family response regulator
VIRIVLVEDQAMLRDSLACTINAQDDMRVVSSLADATEALAAVERTGADCALLDVCTENDSSGIVAARRIKGAHPAVRVVIMTGMPELTFIERARDAGADSFVYKNVGTAELLGIIRSTMEGYSTFPVAQHRVMPEDVELSPIEISILRLVCESKTRREIAAELYLSEGTVKRRISEILAKTGYDSILRLAVHAVSSGIIVPGMGERDESDDATGCVG